MTVNGSKRNNRVMELITGTAEEFTKENGKMTK